MKELSGKSKAMKKLVEKEKEKKERYVLIRSEANDNVTMVQFEELISTKTRGKLIVGDIVSHGLRDKRIRGKIILLGEFPLVEYDGRRCFLICQETKKNVRILFE